MKIEFEKVLDKLNIGVIVLYKYSIIYANQKAKELLFLDLDSNISCYFLFYQYSSPCSRCIKSLLGHDNPKISFTLTLNNKVFIIEYCYFSEDQVLIFIKDAEEEIYHKNIYYTIFENLPVFIFFIKKGKIKYLNRFSEKKLSYTKQELIEKPFIETLVSTEEKLSVERILKEISKKREEELMLTLLDKEGKSKTCLGKCFTLKDIDKEDIVVIAGMDITEFLDLKEKLDNIHKTQSFGSFLRSLVHDFNNVLQQIEDYLKDIEKNLNNPEKIKKYLDLTEKTLSSWIDLNKFLLDYTKEFREIEKKRTEIVSFLKNNLELFQLIAGSRAFIQLDFNYLFSVWIPGDELFWRYIFLNFISNAKDAIEEGTISLILRAKTERGKKYLNIFIKDTGCGIPEEYLDKIFQPFFTTKEKSSGLGLFLIKNHINNIGGKIEVESKAGEGTTFKITVPVIEIKKIKEKKKKPEDICIVIVEDEEVIRENLREVLEEEGYKVYVFSSGSEVRENLEDIERADLLISDFHLPDIKGGELYQMLKRKFPNIDVIFLTGDIFGLAELPTSRVILKPFNIEDLFSKIKELLQ